MHITEPYLPRLLIAIYLIFLFALWVFNFGWSESGVDVQNTYGPGIMAEVTKYIYGGGTIGYSAMGRNGYP